MNLLASMQVWKPHLSNFDIVGCSVIILVKLFGKCVNDNVCVCEWGLRHWHCKVGLFIFFWMMYFAYRYMGITCTISYSNTANTCILLLISKSLKKLTKDTKSMSVNLAFHGFSWIYCSHFASIIHYRIIKYFSI